MVDRLRGRPNLTQNVDIFCAASVAPAVIHIIAVLRLIVIPPAGNDVHGEAAAAQLIQCGELARRDSGRDEAWSMG